MSLQRVRLVCFAVLMLFAPAVRAQGKAENVAEAAHYRIESLPVPEGTSLEAGGLGFAGDTLYVGTRRGEIWSLRPTAGKNKNGEGTWQLFASGLHEILGVLVNGKGDLVIAQRPELTRVRDTNRDGRADRFETLTQGFGLSGNYHEYHFGPVRDARGNLFGTLNLSWVGHGGSSVPYRGWAYKLTPAGEFVPFASGLRSPSGIAISPDGDVFVTDNQGDFWATSPLLHVREGKFFGHPSSLRWEKGYQGIEDSFELPMESFQARRTLPVAWFVYGVLGHAPSQPIWDQAPKGQFGPFQGQMFVGDQTKSMITRVVLDRVGGEFQAALIPFVHGFSSGIVRMVQGPDHKFYVGGTDRGWGAVGGRPFAIERVVFTGKAPFEMHSVKLTETGFDVTFTRPIDPASLQDGSGVSISHHGYNYWKTYGSPHVGTTAVPKEQVQVTVSPDRLHADIKLPELLTERVYTIALPGARDESGEQLVHATAYYTLIRKIVAGEKR